MKAVIISGMHRSGTSMLAQMCQRLGLYLGQEYELIPGGPENPHGFFEHRRIKELNQQILERFGGDWSQPPSMPTGWEMDPVIADLRSQAAMELDSLVAQAGDRSIGYKDPRLCLTMDLWARLTEHSEVILVVRDPAEVATSLEARNDLRIDEAFGLWNRYIVSALSGCPSAHVILHDRIFQDPMGVATEIADRLELEAAGDSLAKAAAAVRPELRRSLPAPAADSAPYRLASWLFTELSQGRRPEPVVLASLRDAWNPRSQPRNTLEPIVLEPETIVATPLSQSRDQADVPGQELTRLRTRLEEAWYGLERDHARIARIRDDATASASPPSRYPDFILLGAQHTQAPWLRDGLSEQPHLWISPDEPQFFDRRFARGLDWYRDHFTATGSAVVVGEFAPTYLYWPHDPARTAARIHGTLPDVRLIVVLGDPIERACRTFRRQIEMGRIPDTITMAEYLRATSPEADPHGIVAGGWYGRSLRPFVSRFGKRLLVFRERDLQTDPAGSLASCIEHIGAAPSERPIPSPPRPGKMRDGLSEEQADEIGSLFNSDLRTLKELLDIPIEEWSTGVHPQGGTS